MADDGGLSKFQRRMQAIPKAVRDAAAPAVVKAAEDIADTMRMLAPEDTGALKESIVVTRPGQATPSHSQPGGSRIAGGLEALVSAGNDDVRYAHLVEYGHAASGFSSHDVPAKPFFWPGFRLMRKRAASRIKRAVSKAVKDNWGKP